MKLIDLYEVNRAKYEKYVILIKAGNFYEVFNDDAFILNNLFNYKIKEFNFGLRTGFPVIAYNKVLDKLNSFKINYLVLDKFEIVVRKKFAKNNYSNYVTKNLEIDNRILKINQRLNALKNSPKIKSILEEVEKII